MKNKVLLSLVFIILLSFCKEDENNITEPSNTAPQIQKISAFQDTVKIEGKTLVLGIARDVTVRKQAGEALRESERKLTTLMSNLPGLFVLGTMNSADRSTAILDLAVRRRFAFVDLWPDIEVVDHQGLRLATEAFGRLLDIFAQYAPDDALVLVPGHAYFLAVSERELANRLKYELFPLILEYLQEGRLASCESELRAYLANIVFQFHFVSGIRISVH